MRTACLYALMVGNPIVLVATNWPIWLVVLLWFAATAMTLLLYSPK